MASHSRCPWPRPRWRHASCRRAGAAAGCRRSRSPPGRCAASGDSRQTPAALPAGRPWPGPAPRPRPPRPPLRPRESIARQGPRRARSCPRPWLRLRLRCTSGVLRAQRQVCRRQHSAGGWLRRLGIPVLSVWDRGRASGPGRPCSPAVSHDPGSVGLSRPVSYDLGPSKDLGTYKGRGGGISVPPPLCVCRVRHARERGHPPLPGCLHESWTPSESRGAV